jgi:hypothetical protein
MSTDSTTTPTDVNTIAIANPTLSSCARADAKPQDRDVQMKYDIAKNEDGPLKRTMRGRVQDAVVGGKSVSVVEGASTSAGVTAERHPGVVGRLETLEGHLAVRYGTSLCLLLWTLRV